jgi:hypothetical protein
MSGSLPDDADARNQIPLAEGVLDYFPNALCEVAKVSAAGNRQHNGDQPLHWARGKSTDHRNKIARHLIDTGKRDGKGIRHSAYLAWRALALLQEEIEREEGAPLPRNAKPAEPVVISHRLAAEIMRDRAEADDPAPHDGRLFTTPSDDAE